MAMSLWLTWTLLLISATDILHAQQSQSDWGYSAEGRGPDKWHDAYPACGRPHQSPINFDTLTIGEDTNLGRINFIDYDEFPPNHQWSLLNNGYTITLKAAYPCPPQIQGGSLHAKYELLQVHFHWGHVDFSGSEHHLDGRQYPLEMHIVHRRRNRSQTEIQADEIGLAVVGIFFELGNSPNDHLTPITDALRLVVNPGVEHNVTLEGFNLHSLMPHIPDYFRYNGSLTTPPCDTIVQWSVMRQPVRVSRRQMEAFRALRAQVPAENTTQTTLIRDNFRPVQALAGRKVIYYVSYSSPAPTISASISALLMGLLAVSRG